MAERGVVTSELYRPGLAILASDNQHIGSVESVMQAASSGLIDADLRMLISGDSQSPLIDKAQKIARRLKLDLKTQVIDKKDYPRGQGNSGDQSLEQAEFITKNLVAEKIGFVALVGYPLRPVGALLEEYALERQDGTENIFAARMVQSHFGPTPLTKNLNNLNAQKRVIKEKYKYSAQSLLAVTYGPSNNLPIFSEHRIPILPGDTPKSLFNDLLVIERRWLAQDLGSFIGHHINHGNKRPEYVDNHVVYESSRLTVLRNK